MADEPEHMEAQSSVERYFIKRDGVLFETSCVEVNAQTAYFKIEESWVRKGLFPSTKIDIRDFKSLGVQLMWVLHPLPIEH
jgi:hypothetical protein